MNKYVNITAVFATGVRLLREVISTGNEEQISIFCEEAYHGIPAESQLVSHYGLLQDSSIDDLVRV